MSSTKKLVSVMGATGSQGGSVVRFLLQNPREFAVRAVVRDPQSAEAQKLKQQGVEVVFAHQDDVESLKKAFTDVYGVFSMTKSGDCRKETQRGINTADAAKATVVRHFVWSTLEVQAETELCWRTQIDDHIRKIGLPATFLLTSFYYENLLGPKAVFPPKKEGDGTLVWHLPLPRDSQMPMHSVADLGAFVVEALRHPDRWLGLQMRIAAEFITPREIEVTFVRVTGKKARVVSDDMKKYRQQNDDLYLMFNWFLEHPERSGVRDVKLTHEIYPQVHTFESFLKENEHLWKNL